MEKKYCDGMLEFVNSSPTCYHAVKNISDILKKSGYTELCEADAWNIKRGGKYFVTRSGSSVIAFDIPQGEYSGYMITASHSDSPSYKIKENSEVFQGNRYTKLSVEGYGGMIGYTWFDKPLSAAGRVMLKTEKGISSKLIDIDRDLLIIPSVAIHMNRNANSNFAVNAACDTVPLFALGAEKGKFEKLVADVCGGGEILGTDLYVYNRQKGTYVGADGELVCAPRLDDLECAYSALTAFCESENKKSANVLCVFNNEEVGSSTKQGAASTFLTDVLERIGEAMGEGKEAFCRHAAQSFMISADNAHAVHPNHSEYADANHSPEMNAGIVVKYNANQRYTTDAVSAAVFCEICRRANVPTQKYANRADIPGGSTLGSIANTKYSINTVDIGLAQLAMHSSYETAGALDVEYLVRALKEFYSSSFEMNADGEYSV